MIVYIYTDDSFKITEDTKAIFVAYTNNENTYYSL
jgi:hypothetical protein